MYSMHLVIITLSVLSDVYDRKKITSQERLIFVAPLELNKKKMATQKPVAYNAPKRFLKISILPKTLTL